MNILAFIFSFLSMFGNISSPVISEVGAGSNELIAIADCDIISNNVVWDRVGSYEVSYFHNKDKQSFSRQVNIFDRNGDNHLFSKEEGIINENYQVMDIKEGEKGLYFSGSIPSGDKFAWTTLPQNYGFISYYEKEQLVWEIRFSEYSYISSFVVIKGDIYALCTMENSTGSTLKLLKITDGIILDELIIGYDKKSYGDEMVLINDRLYVHCYSTSRYGDLSYLERTQYIGVLEIDYKHLQVINSYCFGNVGDNSIVCLDYDEESICLVIRISGFSGPFVNIYGTYSGNFLVVYDLELELIEWRYIPYTSIREIIMTKYDYIALVAGNDGNKAWLDMIVMMRELDIKQIYRWEIDGNNHYIYEVFHTRTQGDKNFVGINTFSFDRNKVEFAGILEYKNNYNFGEVAFYPSENSAIKLHQIKTNDDGNFLLVGEEDKNTIFWYSCCLRERNWNTYSVNNREYEENSIYLNGNRIAYLGIGEANVFGHHEEKLIINDAAIVALKNRFYIESVINVQNNYTYDKGLRLIFNGAGSLNGEIINSGKTIEEVGEYNLVVSGTGEERRIINFRIDELSLNEEEVGPPRVEIGEVTLLPAIKPPLKLNYEFYIAGLTESKGVIITLIITFSFMVLALLKKIKFRRHK